MYFLAISISFVREWFPILPAVKILRWRPCPSSNSLNLLEITKLFKPLSQNIADFKQEMTEQALKNLEKPLQSMVWA